MLVSLILKCIVPIFLVRLVAMCLIRRQF